MPTALDLVQPALPGICAVTDAVNTLSDGSSVDERGAIFTRREVVEFILDMVGYRSESPIYAASLLEPSFGDGDFLLVAVERLLKAWKRASASRKKPISLDHAIRGVELHVESFRLTRVKVIALLCDAGIAPEESNRLAQLWLTQGDYLLAPIHQQFDYIVGNPPYVRQELIPPALLREYRNRFATMFDRADLYVAFIERSLHLLSDKGQLSFICADRWTKNRYGGPLRELVSAKYHLSAYVDMVDTPAFHSDVIAYPAITVIKRNGSGATLVAERPEISRSSLGRLATAVRESRVDTVAGVRALNNVVNGREPWVLHRSDATDLVRRLEAEFPALEASGCKVGIGVATGADKAFIGIYEQLDVEVERKLPLAMTRDISTGRVNWRGYGVLNPFNDDGTLVDLTRYPRFRAYLERHREAIVGRHVAKRDSTRWYRTIDRITPSLTSRAKLLIPDIKGEAQVVFEPGNLYPHHNLYYVISDEWDLHALQGVLLSKVARLFISTYSTRMRGGFLRFQAQYLRRIRLPAWNNVPVSVRDALSSSAQRLDLQGCDEAAAALFKLTPSETSLLDNLSP